MSSARDPSSWQPECATRSQTCLATPICGATPSSTARSVTAWDVRDRAVAVHSPPELVDRYAGLLAGWTADISLVDPGEVIAARVEEGTLKGLALRDGSLLPCEAVLVHAPLHRRDDLAERLGLTVTEDGFVEVDAQAHTSLAGVYAAGDLAFAPQQVAVAMGSGHVAGLVATRELLLGRSMH